MYIFNPLLLLCSVPLIQAFAFSDVYNPGDILNLASNTKNKRNIFPSQCPQVWTQISGVLTKEFLNTTNGQCNDMARASIRAAFYDCASWNITSKGGCDGSLFLAQEYNRFENNGLQNISIYLGNLAKQYNVGVADMIQFAAC